MTELIQCGLGLSLALCGVLILGLSLGLHCLERRGREVLRRLERLERGRRGFTLVELLVVIAIVGVLIALICPAVQWAREAARRTHCANNLRQLALGFQLHEGTQKHLPTGGWGYSYIGDPDLGYDHRQPGGWPYAILDFIERSGLRRIGYGAANGSKAEELARLARHPIATFHCASFRRLRTYPVTLNPANAAPIGFGAKSDYAASAGAGLDELGPGSPHDPPTDFGGIASVKSTTRLAEIRDGLSNTLLLAEKFVHPLHALSGTCLADNEQLYIGLDNDTCRSTKHQPQTIGGREGFPFTFGSYHPHGLNVALCDGSIQSIAYSIDPRIWRSLGTRAGHEINLRP